MQPPARFVHWLSVIRQKPECKVSDTIFHDQVIAILPRLRVQALALTRNRAGAEDLVQDAVCNALSAQDSFIPGTNFAAWMHRILRNRFISNLRKRRDTTDIEDVPSSAFASEAPHEDRLALKELARAMARLPSDQREALVMVVLNGMSYEALAEATGCAVGTAKSRVFRARRQLEAWLMGERPAATETPARPAAAGRGAGHANALARSSIQAGNAGRQVSSAL
jgi:RNA polymerase sigma-70 factor (ECF subfamily)